MRVGVCDFPSSYAFPPHGYGGIERWLWAAAVGAKDAGADVLLIGPSWREDVHGFARLPLRLEQLEPGSQSARRLAERKLDLLVVGHEYPSLPAWRSVWEALDCDVATFQHDPDFRHPPSTFGRGRARLYCYSEEMAERYRIHNPRRELAVHLGWKEDPLPATAGRDLVWMGRIHEDKAPHLAILASARLGRRLRLVGPVLDATYASRCSTLLHAEHVEVVGEIAGARKTELLRDAAAMIYTCAPGYVEAGAAVFGEALRAGTPVAALAWGPGGCPQAALCQESGVVSQHDPQDSTEDVVEGLGQAISQVLALSPPSVQEIGLHRFQPERHFHALAS